MSLRIRFSMLLFLLLVPATGVRLVAQSDVRISPPDGTRYLLAEDARIQAAAELEGDVLAVWGNRSIDSAGSNVNRLAGRLIVWDSNVTLDVHSPAARPFGFVSVVAMENSFVVIWNDRRSEGPGIYLARIDRRGVRAAPEISIGSGQIDGGRLMLAGDLSRAPVLLWNIVESGIFHAFAARLGSDGKYLGTDTVPGVGAVTGFFRVPTLPGSTIVRMNNGTARHLSPDGRFDTRVIYGAAPERGYFFADSSTVEVAGGTVTFRARMFDSTVTRTFHLPALDSATAGTVVVTSAHPGELSFGSMYYHRESVRYGFWIERREIRTTLEGSPTFDSITSGFYQFKPSTTFCQWTGHVYRGATILRGCDNRFEVSATYRNLLSGRRCVDMDTSFHYYVASDGRIDSLPEGGGCAILNGSREVKRTTSDTASAIRIVIGSDTIRLAESIPGIRYPYDELSPGLFVQNDTLCATWISKADSQNYMIARRSNSNIGWNVLAPMHPGTLGGSSSGDHYIALSSYRDAHGLRPLNRNAAIVFIGSRMDDYWTTGGTSVVYYTRETSAIRIYAPTPGGWTLPSSNIFSSIVGRFEPSLESIAASFDGDIVASVFSSPDLDNPNGKRDICRIRSGVLLDTWSNVLPGLNNLVLLPMGADSVIAIRNQNGYVLKGGVKVAEFLFDSTYVGIRYHPLRNQKFLRLDRSADDSSRYVITLFDIEGRKRAARDLSFSSPPSDVIVTQNIGTGMIALVWTARNRIYYSTLEPRLLGPIEHEVVASDQGSIAVHPSALFRNDSLHIVWDDTRNGGHDIYTTRAAVVPMPRDSSIAHDSTLPDVVTPHFGTIITLPPYVGSSEVPAPVNAIYPNPAVLSTTLDFYLSFRSNVAVEICSMEGRIERRIDLGELHTGRQRESISLDGILPGNYMLRLVSEFGSVTTRLVVAPQR